MATKSDTSRRRRRRRGHLVASGASAIWRRRRRRVLVLAVGCAIVLAWSAPYLIKGWNYFAEQAAINLIYSPRDIEGRAYKAGQKLAKRTQGMSDTQLERTYDRYVEGLKVDIPPEKLSVGRKAFIHGYKGKKK
jgi:hypothetical protein